MNMQLKKSPSLALLCVLLGSCFPETSNDNLAVVTEAPLYISGVQAKLMGRVLSTTDISIEDHGFEVSESSGFNNPRVISLGPTNKPGQFVAVVSELTYESNYHYRSFAKFGEQILYGEALTFATLGVELQSVTPLIAFPGDVVTITGKNMGANVQVFFGSKQAEILSAKFESEITVKVPPIGADRLVSVRLIDQDTELVYGEDFEYVVGKWEKVSEFPNNLQLRETVFFRENSSLIAGLGVDNLENEYDKLWKFDFTNSSWTDLGFPGIPLRGAFASEGVFGAGAYDIFFGIGFANDSWSYGNSLFNTLPDFPAQLYKPVSFTIDNVTYVTGGVKGNYVQNFDTYSFNRTTDTWTQLAPLPFAVTSDNAWVVYNSRVYFILANRDVVEYNPVSNTATVVGQSPSLDALRGVGVVLGDKLFFGLFERNTAIWEFNPVTGAWKQKNHFPQPFYRTTAFCEYNGNLFVLRRVDDGTSRAKPNMSMWKFEPNIW